MRRRIRAGKLRRTVEALLLLAGLAGVGVWVWSNARLKLVQRQENQALERKLASRPAPAPLPAPRPAPLATDALVGRLVIPRLKLQAMVREGDGAQTLDVALGHVPGTALPGQTGNVAIAGHRDTLLRGLRHIEKNDVIQLQTAGGNYSYQVENTSIVTPDDVAVLAPSRSPELTLITCYPFYYVGPAPKRFIVKARLQTPVVDASAPPTPPVPAPAPVPVTAPAPEPPVKPPLRAASATHPKTTTRSTMRKVRFQVSQDHSRELAPGIRLGLSSTDVSRGRATGWLWVGQERRTIWLRNRGVYQPLLFHSRDSQGDQRTVLTLTSVARNSVSGYLVRMP
jgi:sortase A